MCDFEPSKQHLREVLLHYHVLNKTIAETRRLLKQAYGEHAPSEPTCREWFRRFKSGNFEIKDKERPGQPKKFEDEELKEVLDEDPCQTLKSIAETLNVDESTVSKRLKLMGIIQKQGRIWLPYELNPRNIERRFTVCEMLLQRHRRKSFLHRIVTGTEKWLRCDNPKRKKLSHSLSSPSTSKPNINISKVMLCIWWDQLGVVFYEFLKPTEINNSERYKQQILQLDHELKTKRLQYANGSDLVIYHHDSARVPVAKLLKETFQLLGWEILPHPPYSPDIAPSDYLFQAMQKNLADQHFSSLEDMKKWLESWFDSKGESFFRRGIDLLPEKWEKVVASDGQYFE